MDNSKPSVIPSMEKTRLGDGFCVWGKVLLMVKMVSCTKKNSTSYIFHIANIQMGPYNNLTELINKRRLNIYYNSAWLDWSLL